MQKMYENDKPLRKRIRAMEVDDIVSAPIKQSAYVRYLCSQLQTESENTRVYSTSIVEAEDGFINIKRVS